MSNVSDLVKHWRGQPDHDHWRKPFTASERAWMWWGFSGFFGLLAVLDWLHPKQPPFSGKWSWLYSWAYSNFGSIGIVRLMLAVSAILFIAGFVCWFERGYLGRGRDNAG